MPFEPGSLTVRRVDANTWSLVDELVYRGNRQRFVVGLASLVAPPGAEQLVLPVPAP